MFNSSYLWFFLEPIMGAKAENYSFLKKLLENIKQTRDQQDPDNNLANEVITSFSLMLCKLSNYFILGISYRKKRSGGVQLIEIRQKTLNL